jgi:hypothetical protein
VLVENRPLDVVFRAELVIDERQRSGYYGPYTARTRACYRASDDAAP